MNESADANEAVGNGKGNQAVLSNTFIPPKTQPGKCQTSQASTASATGNPRNKVALKPGRSLLDWIRLGHSGKDLTGVRGQVQQVTPEQLMQHNQRHDAWICLRGKVYNITPYMEFHPGGEEELMKGAGKDATELFNSVHNWVNAESMLQKCFVGYLDATSLTMVTNPIMKTIRPNNAAVTATVMEAIKPPEINAAPKFTWSQSSCTLQLRITVPAFLSRESIVVFCRGQRLTTLVHFNDLVHYTDIDLEHGIEEHMKVNVTNGSESVSIVEIELPKKTSDTQCSNLGNFLQLHDQIVSKENRELQYVRCTLIKKHAITHDTWIFALRLPAGCHMLVPVGHHIHLRQEVDGVIVVRSFTPIPPDLLHGVESDSNLLHLMIKIYKCGIFTPLLQELRIGDTIDTSDFSGSYNIKMLHSATHLVLLAAGTGFTPMCGIIRQSLQSNSKTTVTLVFFNKKQQDILWKDQLDVLNEENERFSVHHVLSEPDSGWSGEVGKIRADILVPLIPSISSSDLHICICGPVEFTETSLRILHDFGVGRTQIHAFMS